MPLDKASVAHIARLARIATTDEERERLARELSAILEWVEQLNEVATDGVEPMTGAVEMPAKSRPDDVTDGGVGERLLAEAPRVAEDFFVVPKVVE